MTARTLRRYTNLASALHILHNRCLTLLSPDTWDDRNDSFFMSEYKRLKGVKTVLAICIADREETYHHWQVFSRGADGVCIEFDREELVAAFDNAAGVIHGYINYEQIANANSMQDVDLEILPWYRHHLRTEKVESFGQGAGERRSLTANGCAITAESTHSPALSY